MVGFFKKLFGGGDDSSADAPAEAAETYQDCTIIPTPMKEGGQWRLAGKITKTVEGQVLERTYIRADIFNSKEEAVRFAITKGQQVIDQNKQLFSDGEPTGTA